MSNSSLGRPRERDKFQLPRPVPLPGLVQRAWRSPPVGSGISSRPTALLYPGASCASGEYDVLPPRPSSLRAAGGVREPRGILGSRISPSAPPVVPVNDVFPTPCPSPAQREQQAGFLVFPLGRGAPSFPITCVSSRVHQAVSSLCVQTSRWRNFRELKCSASPQCTSLFPCHSPCWTHFRGGLEGSVCRDLTDLMTLHSRRVKSSSWLPTWSAGLMHFDVPHSWLCTLGSSLCLSREASTFSKQNEFNSCYPETVVLWEERNQAQPSTHRLSKM